MFDVAFLRRLFSRRVIWLVFALLLVVYGALAIQGALPFMSPDETGVFASARALGSERALAISEPRAMAFSWLHPRSFVAQDGILLPVTFPLWPFILSLIGWMGQGGVLLWAAVVISASALIPLAWLFEEELKFSRVQATLLAFVVMTLPTMVLYGNRSLFTLVPQLALFAWTVWLTSRLKSASSSMLVGLASAVVIGLRPVEIVWLLPILFVALVFWSVRSASSRALTILWWILGLVAGFGMVGAIHALVYGVPWQIGYLLRDTPPIVTTMVSASATVTKWWQPFFPFGFSRGQLRQNILGSFFLGWWPWMVFWAVTASAWLIKTRFRPAKRELLTFGGAVLLTLWLVFYYGQGRYADNIGGLAFHLGSSLYRYLTPVVVAWTIWSFWTLRRVIPDRFARPVFFSLAIMHVVSGTVWAYTDPVDGILQNRADRQSYQRIREVVLKESTSNTIWLSDRSDKILFPWRAAVSPLPSPSEIRRFLERENQPVWIFRRPPGQQERDAWLAAGLELVEKERFAREIVYEVRKKAGE
ncbi:hypothetical protein KBB27_01345 [Patescibacteria group bacterium]|nr:hypothetical protein [Patescibacteria group bacterium]